MIYRYNICSFFIINLNLSFFFFKQKTAYEMLISYWSSDVCSSDLARQYRWRGRHRRKTPWAGPIRRRCRLADWIPTLQNPQQGNLDVQIRPRQRMVEIEQNGIVAVLLEHA